MIRDSDLDRILATWLAEGGERAPRRYVDAALDDIATTGQRSRWLGIIDGWPVDRAERSRLLLVAALLAMLALGVAIGIGSQLLQPPTPLPPAPPAEIVPSAAPVGLPALIPQAIEDWPVAVSIPEGWSEIEGTCCDYRQFAGIAPEGHLSIGHESPYWSAVCAPECTDIQVPQTIPYDAVKQLTSLKAAVAAAAGSDAWEDLPPDVLPDVIDGARLDTSGPAADGREWRRVHIVGLKARNLVTVTFSQPADVFDEALLDAILADTTLLEAPVYSDGDLIHAEGDAFSMPIPGSWITMTQPTLDGVGLSGVRQFGDGEVVVSIGDADGAIGWCDPDCREISGQTSLDALEATIRDGHTLDPAVATTLGGEPALSIAAGPGVTRRYVVAMHDGRPVILRIDPGTWDVAPGIIEEMIAGFAFTEVELPSVAETFTAADGRVELALPGDWQADSGDDGVFIAQDRRMTVTVGDEDGTITTCAEPAAPWELCRAIQATTLDELAAAVQPGPLDDHGVGPPEPRRDTGTLDGESSVVTRIQAYEYPAAGGQEVVYIVAMHDGRPVIVRIHTTDDELVGVESVIAGFRFVD